MTVGTANWPVGRTIKSLRWLSKAELATEGWMSHEKVAAFVLDDGTLLFASADEEGNHGGALFGRDGDDTFAFFPAARNGPSTASSASDDVPDAVRVGGLTVAFHTALEGIVAQIPESERGKIKLKKTYVEAPPSQLLEMACRLQFGSQSAATKRWVKWIIDVIDPYLPFRAKDGANGAELSR
jgi:hypothetical protein